MRTTTIFAETHTSERANHVAYRLVNFIQRRESSVARHVVTVLFVMLQQYRLIAALQGGPKVGHQVFVVGILSCFDLLKFFCSFAAAALSNKLITP